MVYENWQTRSHHITSEGHVIKVTIEATWDEWDAQGYDIPQVGDYWSADRPELRVTDISVEPKDGNTRCLITATYSTEAFEARRRREDQANSWLASTDAYVQEQNVDVYYNRSDSEWHVWSTEVRKVVSDAGATAEQLETLTIPPLVYHDPKVVLRMTTYGSKYYIHRLLGSIGKVNSDNFFSYISSVLGSAMSFYDDDQSAQDTSGYWLLQSCRIEPVRSNCWRYDWEFLGNPLGWQKSPIANGLNVAAINTYQYETTSFSALFANMDKIEPDYSVGLYT